MDYYISPSSSDPGFDSWKSALPSLSFPVSDARSIPWSTNDFNLERHRRSSPQPTPTKRIVELPKEFFIQGGFLREKGRLLYTVKHSSVLSALTYTRRNWTLPESLDDRIKAILALETFLNPFDPCHWLFWSNELKDESAKLIHKHLDRTIYHPFSWSALDWKFRLSGLHSKQLPQVLCDFPWYNVLVCTTFLQDSPARGPVLRKRKAPFNSRTTSFDAERADEPPAKRSRVLRARPSHKAADPSLIPNSESSSDRSDVRQTTFENDATPATSSILKPSSSLNPPEVSRQSVSKITRTNPRPPRASSLTSVSSYSPSFSSVALPPPEPSNTRSSSRLSARTLVDDIRDSSPSSATTAADSSTRNTKGKQKVDDDNEAEPRVIDILLDDDLRSVANSCNDNDEDISLTRQTRSRSGASASAKNETGPQRSQLGRKGRANSVLPYPAEKSARVVARSVAAIANRNSAALDVPTPVQPPRTGRKTKKSRK